MRTGSTSRENRGTSGRITVLMTVDEFTVFDAYCARQGYKKSTLITRLIREHLEREGVSQHGRETGGDGAGGVPRR